MKDGEDGAWDRFLSESGSRKFFNGKVADLDGQYLGPEGGINATQDILQVAPDFDALVGAFFIALMINGFNLHQIDSIWQRVIQGAVILAAVSIDSWTQRRSQ